MTRKSSASALPKGSTQFLEHPPAGQDRVRAAGAVGVLRRDVDAEMAVEGGEHVLRRLGIGAWEGAAGVGFADDAAAFDRSAGEGGAEHVGIMIAAGVGVNAWCAAELAPGNHQRRFQKAT